MSAALNRLKQSGGFGAAPAEQASRLALPASVR